MPDKLQALYDNLTKLNPDFKVPVDQFRQDMQDENKLKTLHTNLSKNYPDFKVGYDQFKSDMWSTNPSPAPATAPAVPDVPVTPAPTQTKASAFPDLTPEGLSFQEKPLTVPGGMTSVLPTEVPKMPEVRQTVGATKLAADPIQVFEQKNIVPSVEQAAAAKPEEYFKEGITEVAGAAQPSKVTEAPPLSTTGSPVGDYIKTIGSSFLTSGKTALAETGIAIVDQVNQVNNLLKNISDNPTWQKYAANVSSTVAEDMNNLRRMKAEAGQLTGKPGEFIGSMIPFAGMAAATMVSKSPALAAATTGLFAEMGYGSGIEAYDQYKKETGGDTDPKARAGAGILYGAAMSVPISRYLGKLMPKGLFQKALSGVLASNPAATEVLGKEIFENFAKKSPGLAKRLLTVSAKGALHGAAAMEAMELSKKAVDDFVIGKNVTFSDYLKTAVDAAQSGAAFGLMTAPFGVYAQSSANTDRRRMQGSVTITMDPNGRPVEIIPTKDGGQEGLTPNGRIVEVTPDMAKNSVTIPTPEFENFIKIHKETGSAPVTFDRDVYAGRTRDILNNASGGGEFVNIAKDAEGNSYFVIGKDENGNYRAVDTNGTEGVLDANTPVSRVNKGAAYTSLLKEFDANQKAQEAENQRNQQRNDFIVARDQAAQTVRQNFDALAQPDGNLHVGVDKSGNEVVIVSQTPGGYAILADGTQVDISDIKDIQLHPFESLFGQQMAEFDAANDPDLQPAVAPQVQSTFNWNGRTMQLTDVSDRNDLMVQEIDAEGEPVGRPEKISAEEYRKVIEQQVDQPDAQPELRTYDLAGKQVPFTPKEDGTLVSEDFKTPEEAEAAKTELEKQIGAANDITVNTVPGPDNLAPATYQLAVTPKTEDITEQLFTEAKPEPTDQLFKEGEASYVLNGQPIERGKAMARVKSAIFDGNRKKIENLEVSGDKELTDMIEKAFPIKITIGKKKASTEDALNWIDAADTIEELRKLNIEGAPATNDIRTAYTLKVKELSPEISPEEVDNMVSGLFAPEATEQKVEQPIKTKEDDSTDIERLPSGEPRRETAEQTGPDQTGGRGETATGGNVQGDEQVSREQEQGRTAEVRAEDQRPEAAAEGQGLKPSFKKKKPSPSKLADLYKTRLSKLKKDNPKRYWSVDLPSDEDLLSAAKEGRLIDMAGGMAYVTKDGDLKGLFKYDPEAHGTAKVLQAERIKMGGVKLDAFDTEGTGEVSLVPTYKKNGFREVARVDFNPEFAPEDMPENVKAMNPDVVVMVYDPENKLPIKERRFNKDQYEEALAYRDSYVAEKEVKVMPDDILPKYVADKLTEDKNGNYIFVHYATSKQEILDPAIGVKQPTSASSSGEIAAKASVGGVTDYYAEDIPKEAVVKGTIKHTVLVPKNRVYDLQSDPLDLYDEAKTRFEKIKPGISFDGNFQAAWISKLAAEKGYYMTVSDWGLGLIGKSTTPLKVTPELKKLKPLDRTPKVGDIVDVGGKGWNVSAVGEEWVNLERGPFDENGKPKEKRSIPMRAINTLISDKQTPSIIPDKKSNLTASELFDIIQNKTFAMLTAENPNNQQGTIGENRSHNAQAEEWLKAKNLKYEKIKGKYDRIENSFLVYGMTEKQAIEFAEKFNQESVAHSMGLLYPDGTYQKRIAGIRKDIDYENPKENYFSTLLTKDGVVVPFGIEYAEERTITDDKQISFKKKPFSLNSLIKQAAAETETNPTEAQIEAGNYRKGHVNIQGMDVSIENPKGSVRSGVDEDGKAWETEMKSHYGYFKGTVGKDGDHIDVFIGPKPANQFVFVIDQNDPKTGEFDESKVMLGYDSAADAKAAYLANYEPGWNGFGAITEVPMEQFKGWLYDGARQRKPFGEYVEVKKPISFQARKLYAGLEKVPEFNNLTELTAWLQKWSKKNKVFASDEAKADDDKFVKALVKHTIEELKAFEELSDYPYIGFYDYDIPARLNPELAKFAEKRYGHELSPAQVALYHLVSGFASPSADPVMDSSKGLDVFDKYMRTGKLTSASDKQATVWEVNEQGKKVDTGKPKFDEQGNPVFSQVTVAYATPSLNKFRDNVLGHFKGDLDKAIDWITSVHNYDEIARIMGVPTKGKGSLEEHENLTKTDGGFGIFGFTGPKLGSYILNRLGNFSTVTKDLWYARTMARLTGESPQEKTGEALKLPWNLTVEGKRKRALADKAWSIVADKLGITPADVQQRMWEFEKRLYEKLGAKGSSGTTGYASEGFMKRAKELEPDLFVDGEEVKPSYRKGTPQVSGQNSEAKPFIEQWESDAKFQTPVFVLDNAEIVDRLAERYSKESLQEIRDAEFWGLQVDDEMYTHPDTDPETALLTWAHEKSHIVLENQFPDIAERNRFLRFMHRTIGEKELHRVLPDVYWDETPEQQVKEYFATLVEDVITDEGLLRDAPASVKRIIFDQINEFTTVKYLQDAKTNISRQTSTGGQADARTTETIGRTVQETPGDQAGAETDNGLGRVSSTTDRGKEINKVFSFEDLFEPSYKKETPETIDVDGIKRPTTNSNGQPIHPTEEGIRNFWKWFGDSKVVDEKGRPLVVYHGTAQIFDAFLKSKAKDIEGRRMSVGWGKDKFYFADSGGAASIAASGAEFFGKGKNQNVMPVYLRMLNPMDSEEYERVVSEGINSGKARDRAISDADKFLKGKGIDGIESTVGGYAVFSPNQIKSATGNLGGFDPNDPRISYKRKRELSPDRKQVLTTGEHIREILVNNKLALENWMKDVETVVLTIEDYENPLLKDALAKSKVTHKLRVFEKGAYKNLINAVANVLKTSGITKEELSHYLIAVHGVERNEKFWERQPDRVGEDFSGLTELKQIVRAKSDPAEQLVIDGMNNEAFAQYYQKQIEDKMDPGQAKELWKSIREISKLVRDEMLDSGMISREYYDELNQMYKNYIPLRAWEDSNPEDFEFSRGVGSYTEPIVRAKGRKSLAEDPLATLLQMANTAYISGERNRVKQAAGELVRNNASILKDVVQYNRTYFVNQGTDAQGNPIIQETIDRPDQALFDQGLVTTKVPKQYTARRTSAQAKEFEVEFYRNGRKYVLVFQGSDPAVARAINNKEASVGLDYLNKVVGTDVKIGKITIPSINKMSRYLSSINTTYSVDFPLVNFVRDAPMAILSEWVYGDAKEVAKMFPNMKRAEAAMRRMLRGNADPANNADDAQLEDFFKAGGPTGFAFLKNVDEFKQSITNDVRRINRIKNPLVRMEVGFRKGLDLIGQLAEWSETITRFGVYLNHIQNGESKEKAALAAKNATVNFDQKGRISPALNGLYTFFTAAVQAVDKYFKLWGKNPYKMGGIHMFLMVQAFMNAMLLDLFGGEDDDKVKNYDKVSDYTKRNNLVIPVPGTDKTVSIAVPQILRKFHAIGFDAYDLLSGRKTAEQVMLDELASIPSDVSPIDAEAFLNGEGDLSMKPLVPSILRPIVELEANENFMKLPIVPEPFSIEMAHKIADTRRAYKDVNKIAQWTTDKLYELGGGDETGFKYVYDNGELRNVPALLDISPESIEHLFESYFGGVGKLANRTWKTTGNIFGAGKKLYEGENFKEAIKEIDINTVPVANRFVRTPVGDPLQKEFRKVRNDMENKIKVLDQAEKDQDWAKFEKMYEEIGGKINDYKAIMTTFENLDKAYSIVSKEDKKAAEDLKAQMREQMKEIVKLK